VFLAAPVHMGHCPLKSIEYLRVNLKVKYSLLSEHISRSISILSIKSTGRCSLVVGIITVL